eukprot:2414410-Prymnesium_polylepis.1
MPALEGWLRANLSAIARFAEISARTLDLPNVLDRATGGGVLEKRRACLQLLLEVDLNGTSIQSILLTRYRDLWAGEDGSFSLLRELIKKKIVALTAGQLQVPLVEALTGEVRDMFTNYAMQLFCVALAETNGLILLDNPTALRRMIFECLHAWRIPPLAELSSPLRSVKLDTTWEPPAISKMVPFFSQIARVFDVAVFNVAATQAYLEELEELDDAAWMERMAEFVEVKVRESDDDFAPIVVQYLVGNAPDEIWQRYIRHFVARLCPMRATTEESLQHQVLRAWLTAHVAGSSRKVASLHVAAHASAHEELLKALAASVDALAMLAPEEAMRERIVGVIDGSEDVELSLNAEMVDAFYALMQQQAA